MVQTQSSLSFSLQTIKSLSKTSISSQNLGHPPLFSKCFIYISKLGAFSLICQFFPQHDPHKITHLQTRGILPSLSTKLSSHNMIHTRSHISKLGKFSLICHFFPQHDPHKITHLQTRGILPSLSTKLSFLNMIQTRSQISKLGAFSLVCQWVRISSLEHVSIITPNNIDLQSHPNFSKKISSLFYHFVDSGKLSITSSLQLPSKDSALQAPREMQICL
jgi:hypothetical protein